jgi:hypothetical protein
MKATLTGPSLSFTIHSPGVLVEIDGAPVEPPPVVVVPPVTVPLSELASHPWGQHILWLADNWDQGYGQDELLAWQLTGDTAYRDTAIRLMLANVPFQPYSRNDSREGSIELALMYETLKPHMTAEQRDTFEATLRNWAEGMLGKYGGSHGTRLGDSDEVVGHHFGVRLIDRALGTDYSSQPGQNDSGSVAQMREAIRGFITLAEGGEWIEAGQKYNYGTLQLLLMGVRQYPGEYPEVEAWLPQCAQQLVWHVTSDNRDTVQWGDIEDPHGAALYQWVDLAAMLLPYDQTGDLRKAFIARTRGLEPKAYGYNLQRAIYAIDPRTIVDDGSTLPNPQGFRVSKIGLVLYRNGDTLVQVQAPGRGQVDHYQSSTSYRIYDGGEWIVDHPLAYQAEPANQAYAFGFPAMAGFQEMTEARETADGFVVAWRTGGVLRPSYQWSPPAFVDELAVRLEYTHSTSSMHVTCTLQGTPPERKSVNDGGFYDYELARIVAAKAPLEVFQHMPAEPTPIDGGFTWKTKAGRAVTLLTTAQASVEKVEGNPVLRGNYHPQEVTGWLVRLMGESRVEMTVGPSN